MLNTRPPEVYRELRGHDFYPSGPDWQTIPRLYAQDGKGQDAIVHLHYFAPWGDWYVTEVDHATGEAFGWAMLNGDLFNAEWGYMDLPALESESAALPFVVERDLHFQPKPAREALPKD